jgi:hypothetical protein
MSGDTCLNCNDPACPGGSDCPADKQGLIHWIDEKRKEKVAKLLAVVPVATEMASNEFIAVALERYDAASKKWLATKAKCRVPSDVTWRLLVEAVRSR